MSKVPAWAYGRNVFFSDRSRPTPSEAKAMLRREVNEIMIEARIGYSDLVGKNGGVVAEAKERIATITYLRLIDWFAVCEMGPLVGMKRTCFEYALRRGRERFNDSLTV